MPEIETKYPTEPYKPKWNPYGLPNPELLPGWEPDISKIEIPGFNQEQIQQLGERLERSLGSKLEAMRHLNGLKNDSVRAKSMMQHYGIIRPDVTRYSSSAP